jgi:hypothetical protein
MNALDNNDPNPNMLVKFYKTQAAKLGVKNQAVVVPHQHQEISK